MKQASCGNEKGFMWKQNRLHVETKVISIENANTFVRNLHNFAKTEYCKIDLNQKAFLLKKS